MASAIHANSQRSSSPFVTVDSGVLPENRLGSEMFGHERDAFTGAIGLKNGLLERAHRDTFFLAEVADTRRPCKASCSE